MIPELYDALNPIVGLDDGPLRVFGYTSVRAIGAFVLAFLVAHFSGPRISAWLYRVGMRDRVREYGEFFGKTKAGTPTMGGIIIIISLLAGAAVFCRVTETTQGGLPVRPVVPLALLTILFFGGLGALDDILKVRHQDSDAGLSRRSKFAAQFLFASFFALIITADGTSPFPAAMRTQLQLPIGGDYFGPWDLGSFYSAFMVFMMVAIVNAVNFAVGLDGLASFPVALTAGVYGVFAYIMNHKFAAEFFGFTVVPGMQEVAVLACALVGACVGFLWFNAYPATVFMGDTGSQALGGGIAALAVLTKQEILFFVVGAVFVIEAGSVVIQDYIGVKWLGRRYFFRAPIHHTFQHRGVAETKVVVRFWIISLLSAVLGLATLKLR